MIDSKVYRSKSVPRSLRPVRSKSHIRSSDRQSKEDELDKEPSPPSATTLVTTVVTTITLLRLLIPSLLRTSHRSIPRRRVQVLGNDGDDIVIVRQFACFSGEAKVGDGGDLGFGTEGEAGLPLGFVFVLEVEG